MTPDIASAGIAASAAKPLPDFTPSLAAIEATAARLSDHLLRTPVVRWPGEAGRGSELFIKLELLQRTGSFKARGALNTLLHLRDSGGSSPGRVASDTGVARDGSLKVTAFSAGNHAIATAFAARTIGVPARVVMPRSANAFRVERCRHYGADIVFGESIAELIDIVERLQVDEGYSMVHPFEGPRTFEGTATVGLELCRDLPSLDAVIVPVGGGGLIAGVASAVKQLQPNCQVYGVEPAGACGMAQSLAAGEPLSQLKVETLADSLGAPLHLPLSFALVQRHVDQLVQVSEAGMQVAMGHFFRDMKLAVEPACAATLAALHGPLRGTLEGKRVALIGCGTNIDLQTWQALIR